MFCAVALLCHSAPAQQAPKRAFEVASIKVSKPMSMGRVFIRMDADASMLRYRNVTLKDCIRTAYGVKDFQVQGPDWLASERFDIVAKLPAGSTKDQIPEMLQDLLANRFKLQLHREEKEHPIYALVVGKSGPKLIPAEVQAPEPNAAAKPPGDGPPPPGAMMMTMGPEGAHLKAASATLSRLAETISRFTERPVLDMTGIQGQYDFDLVFTPEATHNMPMMMRAPGPKGNEATSSEPPAERAGSIYEAVQRYGLKLDARKAPMEILVVDHVEKTPTEN